MLRGEPTRDKSDCVFKSTTGNLIHEKDRDLSSDSNKPSLSIREVCLNARLHLNSYCWDYGVETPFRTVLSAIFMMIQSASYGEEFVKMRRKDFHLRSSYSMATAEGPEADMYAWILFITRCIKREGFTSSTSASHWQVK